MKNLALLAKRDETNEFTNYLNKLLIANEDAPIEVRCRNGRIVEIVRFPDSESPMQCGIQRFIGFKDSGCTTWWYNNGESCKNNDWDLIETV